MYLLDTDILIDIQRGYEPALNWFGALKTLPKIPGFVAMELVQDAQNTRQLQDAMALIDPLDILWPTDSDNELALENFKKYHLSHGLGLLDALIAGCAIGHSTILCTFNKKHYDVISNLVTEQPYLKQPT